MVLRKPYAFLIKHFRLIHMIITIILTYLVFKSRSIYLFLNRVIEDSVNKYDAINYINYGIYIMVIILIGLWIVVYWLLKYKDKPRNIYIFSISEYIIISVFLLILYGYMNGFNNSVIDQKTIRMYRDILSIVLIFQYITTIIMFVRGLGFDIKKFNFNKDVQELNLETADGEEIEVSVGIDTSNIMRKVRKRKREFGYFVKEFKVYVIAILIILLIFLGYKGYSFYNNKLKKYHEGDLIGNINNMIIRDSYYSIEDDRHYVIINFDIMRNGKTDRLNTGNVLLVVRGKKYSPDKNVCYKFKFLGNCYKKQYINSNYSNYILTYSVDDVSFKDTYLLYNESYDYTYKVKLDMENWEE